VCLFTIQAPRREWQHFETMSEDSAAAIDTGPVGARIKTVERVLDLLERVSMHLKECKLDLALRVRLGYLGAILNFGVLDRPLLPSHPNREADRVEDAIAFTPEDSSQRSIST
jgi:hypothetical protein